MRADLPILMSGPMVRSTLAGLKTETRRILKPQPVFLPGVNPNFSQLVAVEEGDGVWRIHGSEPATKPFRIKYRRRQLLWVRECFCGPIFLMDDDDKPTGEPQYFFRADGYPYDRYYDTDRDEWRDQPPWHPSIHMPKGMSRLTLEVTAVKVERLQDISEDDAKKEGVVPAIAGLNERGPIKTYRTGFVRTWGDLHGPESWLANPWIAAVTFTVNRCNVADLQKEAA